GQSEAKYLNSPDTPLYQKGLTLFALDRARESIRREAVALFVEGYFDAIGLHQAGVQTAVATCGTALTDKHRELSTKAGARELARDLYVEKVAEKIGAAADLVKRALSGKAGAQQAAKPQAARKEAQQPVALSVLKTELVILASVLRKPELAETLSRSGAVGE